MYIQRRIKILVKIVKKHNLFLIADEVYREFIYDGCKHINTKNFKKLKKTAVIDSLQDTACVARIGCVISKNKLFMSIILNLKKVKTISSNICSNCLHSSFRC